MSRLQDASLSVLFGGGDGSQCNVRAKKASFSSCLLCDATSSHNSIALLVAYFFLFSFVLWWWIYLFRSIFHAYETRLSKGRPAHFTHSVVCSFPSFPSFFPLWCCAMRHAPCAAPPWWSDDDDWRLVPHGNGPWQCRHGRPWSMAAPSPLLLRYLRYHFSSLFFHVHFASSSRGAAVAIAHTALCLAWLGGKPYQKQERRGDQCNGKP